MKQLFKKVNITLHRGQWVFLTNSRWFYVTVLLNLCRAMAYDKHLLVKKLN